MSVSRGRRAPLRPSTLVTWWVLLLGYWLALTGSVTVPELLAGGAVAAGGAVLTGALERRAHLSLCPRLWWIAAVARLVPGVLRDTAIVGGALAARLTGRRPRSGTRHEPLRVPASGAEGATRRGLAVAARSAAPNSIVVDVDEDGTLLLHHLVMPPSTGGRQR